MSLSILHYGDNKNTEGACSKGPTVPNSNFKFQDIPSNACSAYGGTTQTQFSEVPQTDIRSTCNHHQVSEEGLVSAADNR